MIPGEAMSSRRAHLRTMGVGAYTGRMRLCLILVPLCAATLLAQTPSSPIVERVGDTGFIQLQAESFDALDARQQALAYWLTQASIAIDPIIYDQLSQLRHSREAAARGDCRPRRSGIAAGDIRQDPASSRCCSGRTAATTTRTTSQKFLPAFSFEELQQAALKAQTNGAFTSAYADLPPLATPDAVESGTGRAACAIFRCELRAD